MTAATNPIYRTREAWLTAAVNVLAANVFTPAGVTLPEIIRVSTGWPRKVKKGSIGWCYKTSAASDASTAIFVTPELDKGFDVMRVLSHELIHAADDCESKHGGFFAKTHRAIGLVDKPTTCVPGETLQATLTALALELGPYPHASLTHSQDAPKQTTRLLKVECPACGCIIRMTSKWLEEVGTPTCGCGTRMLTPEGETGGPQEDEGFVPNEDDDETDEHEDRTESAYWEGLDRDQYDG